MLSSSSPTIRSAGTPFSCATLAAAFARRSALSFSLSLDSRSAMRSSAVFSALALAALLAFERPSHLRDSAMAFSLASFSAS